MLTCVRLAGMCDRGRYEPRLGRPLMRLGRRRWYRHHFQAFGSGAEILKVRRQGDATAAMSRLRPCTLLTRADSARPVIVVHPSAEPGVLQVVAYAVATNAPTADQSWGQVRILQPAVAAAA